jgi:hypothetical protein
MNEGFVAEACDPLRLATAGPMRGIAPAPTCIGIEICLRNDFITEPENIDWCTRLLRLFKSCAPVADYP